jgi:hypothetical protein
MPSSAFLPDAMDDIMSRVRYPFGPNNWGKFKTASSFLERNAWRLFVFQAKK